MCKEQKTLTVVYISLHVTFFLYFVFVSLNIVCGPGGLCNGFVCHLGKLIPAIHHSSLLYVLVHIQNEDVYPPPERERERERISDEFIIIIIIAQRCAAPAHSAQVVSFFYAKKLFYTVEN